MVSRTSLRWIVAVSVVIAAGVFSTAASYRGRGGITRIATTNSKLAISNLNSQIGSVEKLVAEQPTRFEFRRMLFDLLLNRTQFLGTYGDFSRMKNLTSEAPESLDEKLLRARYLSAIHQFDDAKVLLADAERLAPKSKEIKRQYVAIRLARRDRLSELLEEQLAELKRGRTYGSLILVSGIESELGHFREADAYLEEAVKTYNDTSPFAVAFVYFQRGLIWSEKAGDASQGRRYYEEAVHYLPEFVAAQVHLAEILNAEGNIQEAISHLEGVKTAEDPEPRGLLGRLLRESGKLEEAAPYLKSASTDYDRLLKDYPMAFADHGAEFFTAAGQNPTRALELAKINLVNRRSEHAFIVAIKAAYAANAHAELCSLISEAKSLPPVIVPLIDLVNTRAQDCA